MRTKKFAIKCKRVLAVILTLVMMLTTFVDGSFVSKASTETLPYLGNDSNEGSLFLEEWEFERLGCVEKAILLMAAAELDFETASKAVVIDEAVTLSKKYCDEETYKLINGVLDRL